MAFSTEIPDFSGPAPSRPLRECDCQRMAGHCDCPPDLSRREATYTRPESWPTPSARLSGARRVDPNHTALCGLTEVQRGPILRLIEEVCAGYEEAKAAKATAAAAPAAGRYAENVVAVDLVSVFLDEGAPTVLLVPAGGKILKARLAPALLGSLIAGLGATAGALIGSR